MNGHRHANQQIFMSSMMGFANVASVALALIAAPLIDNLTADYVSDLVRQLYGYEWKELGAITWTLMLYPLTFFLIRASLVTALMTAAFAAVTRFV